MYVEIQRGWLRQCEFDDFTSVVLLNFYRISYGTAFS